MATAIGVGANWYGQKGGTCIAPCVSTPSLPVQVRGNSIIVNSAAMVVGQVYCVELDGQPYIYRKTAENELEVYGLADSP